MTKTSPLLPQAIGECASTNNTEPYFKFGNASAAVSQGLSLLLKLLMKVLFTL